MTTNGATRGLAIAGGTPVRKTPFPPWPYFDKEQRAAVISVLDSGRVNYWTGKEGQLFEKEFAAYTKCGYALALANGTVALELALHVLGIGPGDEVIVTSRSFIASASCVALCGARPVFADVDPENQNITAATIVPLITQRTRAVIAVHLAGWPCDMEPIMGVAKEHGLKVIEDCAQALGATYKGRPVGSLANVATFSFCHDKILSTGGEGGMLTTDDRDLWEAAWAYKDHGKNYAKAANAGEYGPTFQWLHESFGTNWRLTEMQAAIGRIQLRKLAQWVSIRRENAGLLTGAFGSAPGLRITRPPEDTNHAYYKYYAFIEPSMLRKGWDRDRIVEAINAEGVPCYSGSCSEIYLEKAFDKDMQPAERLPVAQTLGETSIMFLVHPTLGAAEMTDACKATEKVLRAATR